MFPTTITRKDAEVIEFMRQHSGNLLNHYEATCPPADAIWSKTEIRDGIHFYIPNPTREPTHLEPHPRHDNILTWHIPGSHYRNQMPNWFHKLRPNLPQLMPENYKELDNPQFLLLQRIGDLLADAGYQRSDTYLSVVLYDRQATWRPGERGHDMLLRCAHIASVNWLTLLQKLDWAFSPMPYDALLECGNNGMIYEMARSLYPASNLNNLRVAYNTYKAAQAAEETTGK